LACLANPMSSKTLLDNLQFHWYRKLYRHICMIPSPVATTFVSWNSKCWHPHLLLPKWLFLPATHGSSIVCVYLEIILWINGCTEINFMHPVFSCRAIFPSPISKSCFENVSADGTTTTTTTFELLPGVIDSLFKLA